MCIHTNASAPKGFGRQKLFVGKREIAVSQTQVRQTIIRK